MRTFTKAAMAATMVVGLAAGMTVLPNDTNAQGKSKQQAVRLSGPVRKVAVELEALTKANDPAAEAKLVELEAAAQSDDDKYFAAVQRLAFEAKRNNMAGVGTAVSALITNPRTPASDLPRYHYFRGTGYYQARNYREALVDLQRAQELGYVDTTGDLKLKIVQARIESGDVTGGITMLQEAVAAEKAAGRPVPDEWYKYAIAKLNAAKMQPQLASWLKMRTADYPSAVNWRTMLVIYRNTGERAGATSGQLDRGQKLDLFRLMRATGSLADQNDYWEYAELAQRSGLPAEAKAVIDEGRATGKVQRTHADINALYTEASNNIRADSPVATQATQARAAADGKRSASVGDVYLATGDYAQAAEMYRLALTKGGVNADEVNTRLGIALARGGQKDAAKQAFAAVTGAPRNDIAGFWAFSLDHPVSATAPAAPATPAAAATPAAS